MKKLCVALSCLFLAVLYSSAQDVPKAEVYLGYGFVRYNASAPVNAFTANGGFGSLQYNFNRYFSVVGELGGVHNGKLTIDGSGIVQPDQTAFTFLFGPRVYLNKTGVVSPFFEYLVGGVHNSRSFNVPNSLLPAPLPVVPGLGVTAGPTSTKFSSTQNAVGMAVGGGIDLRLSKLIAFRPVQLDYLPTHFSHFNVPGLGVVNPTTWQQNLRYSTGIDFRFGGATPPPPTVACSATPSEVLPWGGPVNATVEPTNFNPKHSLDYNWSSTSGTVGEKGSTASIDTASLSPGNYTVRASVTDPKEKKLNSASCSAEFTVKQPQAPQVACAASPTSVRPGEPITVTVQGSSPDQSRIGSRNFKTSAGTVKEGETTAGSQPGEFTSTATLDTTNAPPGPLSVSVGVTDEHGLSASCVASASVIAPPPPQVVSETLISDCDFNNDRKHARVDNACKAVLDEVALRMQNEPNGKLVVVGCEEEQEEVTVKDVAALRAANAKAYLTGGEAKQQIDAARIEIRKSVSACGKKARFYFVPEGGTFTQPDTSLIDESSLPADRMGTPARRKN